MLGLTFAQVKPALKVYQFLICSRPPKNAQALHQKKSVEVISILVTCAAAVVLVFESCGGSPCGNGGGYGVMYQSK